MKKILKTCLGGFFYCEEDHLMYLLTLDLAIVASLHTDLQRELSYCHCTRTLNFVPLVPSGSGYTICVFLSISSMNLNFKSHQKDYKTSIKNQTKK